VVRGGRSGIDKIVLAVVVERKDRVVRRTEPFPHGARLVTELLVPVLLSPQGSTSRLQ
jgi:hypothetical protein